MLFGLQVNFAICDFKILSITTQNLIFLVAPAGITLFHDNNYTELTFAGELYVMRHKDILSTLIRELQDDF